MRKPNQSKETSQHKDDDDRDIEIDQRRDHVFVFANKQKDKSSGDARQDHGTDRERPAKENEE